VEPNRTELLSLEDGEQVRPDRTALRESPIVVQRPPAERVRDPDLDQEQDQEEAGRGNGRPKVVTPRVPDDDGVCRVSLEDYWDNWYENANGDVSYEWNNGILEAKPLPTPPQRDLFGWYFSLKVCYIQTYNNASLIYMETGFTVVIPDAEMPLGLSEQVHKPDLGVVLHSNPVPVGETERSYGGTCDLCIEAVSDSKKTEVLRDTVEKKRNYARAGVKEYFILDPSGRHMHFYRLNAKGRYEEIEPDAEGVIRSEVLPGFQFRLRDLYRMPELEELALDEVYQGYVLLKYQAAIAEAAAEAAARQEAEERAAAEAAARQQAEERATAAEDRMQAMEAELTLLRQQSS
jgi:Uma2 family endonuclease